MLAWLLARLIREPRNGPQLKNSLRTVRQSQYPRLPSSEMPASFARFVVNRKNELAKSSRFWLNINACFLCCFDAISAYRISPLVADPTNPITTTLSLSFRLEIPRVRGQPHGFSVSTQLYSPRPSGRAASPPCCTWRTYQPNHHDDALEIEAGTA